MWSRETVIRQEAERLDQARRWWPDTLPGNEWNAAADDRDAMERREKSSPWMDEEFAAARSRAFLAALDLHRAVLIAEPDLMWHNLRAAIDVVNGDAPSDLPQHKVVAAWRMIFFVVPVISTTFASMSRMFAALGREALGWLFIDEAGQAAPQVAVGALWRSQRAVVVGDPRQLEPVVTLPWSGQKRLCRQFGVDPQWAVSDKERELELIRRVADAVFVISPFRDIVYQLRNVVGPRLPPGAKRLGTIHTTQGKEADVVILALGTATDQAGSRKWASQAPNLLNVAVTRARRRLIVIGDYRNWSQQPNFQALANGGKRGAGGLLTVVDVSTEWPQPA